jgi:hypothetical protein
VTRYRFSATKPGKATLIFDYGYNAMYTMFDAMKLTPADNRWAASSNKIHRVHVHIAISKSLTTPAPATTPTPTPLPALAPIEAYLPSTNEFYEVGASCNRFECIFSTGISVTPVFLSWPSARS